MAGVAGRRPQARWIPGSRLGPSGGRELGGPGRLGCGKASEEGGERSKHAPSPAWAQAVPPFASDPQCLVAAPRRHFLNIIE